MIHVVRIQEIIPFIILCVCCVYVCVCMQCEELEYTHKLKNQNAHNAQKTQNVCIKYACIEMYPYIRVHNIKSYLR